MLYFATFFAKTFGLNLNGIPECDLQLLQTYNFCKSGKINLPSAQWQERISYLQKKWVELGKFIGSYTILPQK